MIIIVVVYFYCTFVIQHGCHWNQLKATYLLTYLYETTFFNGHCEWTFCQVKYKELHSTHLVVFPQV